MRRELKLERGNKEIYLEKYDDSNDLIISIHEGYVSNIFFVEHKDIPSIRKFLDELLEVEEQ